MRKLKVKDGQLFKPVRPVSSFLAVPQAAERNRLCRRLQLKDILPVEMLRFTKYPLLLDNIAKYTGKRTRRIGASCWCNVANHFPPRFKRFSVHFWVFIFG